LLKKWKLISEKVDYQNRLFRIKKERCFIPRTGKTYDYYYEDSPSWVNIVALTEKGKVLLIRQYRHAIRDFTLEIPGGVIDPEDKSPLSAAKRELVEETGYGGAKLKLAGVCRPNPAILNNKTYIYFAKGVRKISDTKFDSTEEVEVVEVSPSKIDKLIKDRKIMHSLVITAFHYARSLLSGMK